MYTHNNVLSLVFKCLNDMGMLESKEDIAKADKWIKENLPKKNEKV